jgi:asparagine synthase (glutamine-hydrolysing)
VPLGAFLSGGIDSSTVVALMQSQSNRPVNTFTVGFHEGEFNEAVHARKVAHHLGTNHTELYVSPQDAMDVIPKLPEMYDEPFADSSQIPTHLISALAREHVTVVLSGEGGDELFTGYNRYIQADRHWKFLQSVPLGLRRRVSTAMTLVNADLAEKVYDSLEFLLPRKSRISLPAEKYQKATQVISMNGIRGVYKRLVSIIYTPGDYARNGVESQSFLDDPNLWNHGTNFISTMQKLDLLTYLPDDLLVKVDRASMAVSLETRVPYLDHNIVEFVIKLPLRFKLRNGESKRLVRRILDYHVPRELTDRPKMGFSVPIGRWLRGPLREWGCALIDEGRLKNEGYLRSETVSQVWDQHLGGQSDSAHQLWNVLMFQSWLENSSQ